jgi:hypothetical protein
MIIPVTLSDKGVKRKINHSIPLSIKIGLLLLAGLFILADGFSRPVGVNDYPVIRNTNSHEGMNFGYHGRRGDIFTFFELIGIDPMVPIFLLIGVVFIFSYANSQRALMREEIRVGEIRHRKEMKMQIEARRKIRAKKRKEKKS